MNEEEWQLLPWRSPCCQGENCAVCGDHASDKVSEVLLFGEPADNRHPLTAYLCPVHFEMIMGKRGVNMRNRARSRRLAETLVSG
jgi:hypothetical protein